MASTIKIKNSSTTGAAPTASDLVQGELAINVTDKRIYTENASGTVVELGTNPSSLTNAGNLTFTGTGNRITGDFSNATFANRTMFQTSTANGNTVVALIPNGTAVTSGFRANTSTDADNTSFFQALAVGSDSIRLYSDKLGTGSYLPMTFYTSNIERMRIDTSGNLLVGLTGTNAGAGRGSVYYGGTSAGIIYLYRGVGEGTDQMRFIVGGTQVGSITTTSSATSYVTSSDYRLKNAVTPMTGALAKVAALKPVTYKWNSDGSDGEGFIAHELAEVCPQAVVGEKDAFDEEGNAKYQGIDTSFLVATLTAAIQELKATVDAQAARITALEA